MLLGQLLNSLLASLVDSNIKMHALVGLGNVGAAGAAETNKYAPTILDALMSAIDDNNEDIAMEAMNGLAKVSNVFVCECVCACKMCVNVNRKNNRLTVCDMSMVQKCSCVVCFRFAYLLIVLVNFRINTFLFLFSFSFVMLAFVLFVFLFFCFLGI